MLPLGLLLSAGCADATCGTTDGMYSDELVGEAVELAPGGGVRVTLEVAVGAYYAGDGAYLFGLEASCTLDGLDGDTLWFDGDADAGIDAEACPTAGACVLEGSFACGHTGDQEARVTPLLSWGGGVSWTCTEPDVETTVDILRVEAENP